MAERRPLVIVSGAVQELPSGDSLPGGSGDVVGPASSTDNHIALFDGATGKLLKSGGKGLPSGNVVGTTDTQTLTDKTFANATQFLASTTTTQDGITITGRAGGASSYRITLQPATLNANRTITFPNETGDVVLTEGVQTLNNKTLNSPTLSTPTINSPTFGGSLTVGVTANFSGNVTVNGAFQVRSASGGTFLASTTTTQDGINIAGRAGGTNSYRVTVQPPTLTANRTATFPDATGDVVLSSGSGTSGKMLVSGGANNPATWADQQITVSATAPGSPVTNQLWLDIS